MNRSAYRNDSAHATGGSQARTLTADDVRGVPMSSETDRTDQSPRDLGTNIERALRRMSIGSVILCALILLYLLSLGRWEGRLTLARVALIPIALWTLVITVYAFHSLLAVSRDRRRTIEDISHRDTLTGAYTPDYLQDLLEKERLRAFETGQSATLAYVKLSGIERVTADHGYTAGNIALKEVIRIIMDGVAPQGIVARLAGLEFAVLMPQTSVPAARVTLRDVLAQIRRYRVDLGEHGSIGHITARIGLAAYPCDADDPAGVTHVAKTVAMTEHIESGERSVPGPTAEMRL